MKEVDPNADDIDVECLVDEGEGDTIKVKKIVSNSRAIQKDINDFAELCSELKMLYTAITRPKKTLIIYDDDAVPRRGIERIWDQLGVVEMVSK